MFLSLDLNECDLDTHVCHDNATCTNTDGSYICECIDGYIGDGFNCSGTVTNESSCLVVNFFFLVKEKNSLDY